MDTSSFEHIVRIQFNALMMTVIKCTVKSRNRQFARRSKREILFCELSDMKNIERGTEDNYSCDYTSFEVLNYSIQGKRLIFRYDRKNPRLLFSSRSTLTVHI